MEMIKWFCSACKKGGEIEYHTSLKGESKENISAYIYGVHSAVSSRCGREISSKDAMKKISWEIKKV